MIHEMLEIMRENEKKYGYEKALDMNQNLSDKIFPPKFRQRKRNERNIKRNRRKNSRSEC